MSSSRLIRLGGLVALVGFVFVFIMETSEFFVIELLYIIALLIAFLGFVALYARQAEQVGVLGLLGFVMSFFGFVSLFAVEWERTLILPILAQVIPNQLDNPDPSWANVTQTFDTVQTIGFLLLFGGWLLFGLATLRAGVLPRGAAVLLMAGAVLAAFWAVDPFGGVFELTGTGVSWGYAAFAWMGYRVWSPRRAAAESSAPITAGGPSLANR